jgi:hypothetical protein
LRNLSVANTMPSATSRCATPRICIYTRIGLNSRREGKIRVLIRAFSRRAAVLRKHWRLRCQQWSWGRSGCGQGRTTTTIAEAWWRHCRLDLDP